MSAPVTKYNHSDVPIENHKENNNLIDLDNAHKDFYELFTSNPNKDMLGYAYLVDNSYYEDLILENPDYYLFRDEVTAIKENAVIFSSNLLNTIEAIEIGPGYGHVLEGKTIPILKYCKDLKQYHAIDISQSYLEKIEKFLLDNTNYKVTTTQADLLNSQIKIPDIGGKKAILFLGGTIGNFDQEQQSKCIQQIANIAQTGDKLIITFDNNHNKSSLTKAYLNQYALNFVLNIIRFYAEINYDFKLYQNHFSVIFSWDELEEAVEINFISKESFSFYIPNHGLVNIQEGQRFKTVKSRKFSLLKIQNLLNNHEFVIKENICYNAKINIIIAEKT
jgi:L-histidine N-alpha-methyltransferase